MLASRVVPSVIKLRGGLGCHCYRIMRDTTSRTGSGGHSDIASELDLLKTDALGRVKVSPPQRETIVGAFGRSGMINR